MKAKGWLGELTEDETEAVDVDGDGDGADAC